jgi:hypothetical protein
MEDLFVFYFSEGNREAALKQLRPKPPKAPATKVGAVGVNLGITIGLFGIFAILVSLSDNRNAPVDKADWFRRSFPVYRGLSLLTLAMLAWGVVAYVLREARINFVFIMGADPRTQIWPVDMLLLATGALVLTFTSWILFMTSWVTPEILAVSEENRGLFHLVLFWVVVVSFFLPFKRLYWRTRKYLIEGIWATIRAPFVFVSFLVRFFFFLALAVLISLVTFSSCFFCCSFFTFSSKFP